PLIHGPDGAKLSKRHGALGVEAYREMGYLPEALRNYLVRKRLRKKGGTVALEAENPDFETRVFGPDQVSVQGRLVGLIRRY
ncbi:MAG: hypothetical protein AAGG99_04785, partial [Pseudomonadota bacterium]